MANNWSPLLEPLPVEQAGSLPQAACQQLLSERIGRRVPLGIWSAKPLISSLSLGILVYLARRRCRARAPLMCEVQ
jgi:hypothetical protein